MNYKKKIIPQKDLILLINPPQIIGDKYRK